MEQVGRYHVLGPLGRGAMGVVYLAEDPLLNRQVAIKTVDLSVEDAEERNFLRDRLLKDARAAAALAHPGIVSVYDVLQEGDMAFLVMEYITGESLAAVLKRTPRPEPAFTLRVLREMASALDYTHARGIIHRDIKPANVMIDASGAAKIMDFGIARIADSRTTTPTGMVMGTVQYMAPEQVKGEALDGKVDQFALAAVAYEMLTGATLFGQHSLATLAYKIVNEAPAPVRQHNAAVPSAAEAAVSRALGKTPQERFFTCGHFVAALEAAYSDRRAAAESPTRTMVSQPAAASSSRMPLLAGVIGAAILGGGLLAWHPWNRPTAAEPAHTAAAAVAPPPAVEPLPVPSNPAAKAPPPKAATPAASAAATKPEPPAAKEKPAEVLEPPPPGVPPPPHPAVEAFEQAKQLNQSGQPDAAIQSLNKAIALHPRFPQALLLRAEIHQKMKQWDAAAADYSQALRMVPARAQGYLERGLCFAQMNQDDLALADFNKTIELRPDSPMAFNQRGLVYARRKDFAKAIQQYDQAIRLAPDAPAAYQFRANARRALGDAAGAQQDMRRFRELKPPA